MLVTTGKQIAKTIPAVQRRKPMKKSVRYLIVLLALSGLGVSFASVGGATKKSGGRQDTFSICQMNDISSEITQVNQCVAQ
jgi:hypothetical protein